VAAVVGVAAGAAFARDVITRTGPEGRERAKNLLRAAGKLADYAIGPGLEAVPEVLLHPPTAEQFTRCAPGLTGVARRTLRTNLRTVSIESKPVDTGRGRAASRASIALLQTCEAGGVVLEQI
jgi:hypothetical protein